MNYSKPTKIRSKKITQSARGERCTIRVSHLCSNMDTTVFCHAPSNGKGVATKSDDFWGAYGCLSCHMLADNGHIEPSDWLRAIFETQKILIQKGLITIK